MTTLDPDTERHRAKERTQVDRLKEGSRIVHRLRGLLAEHRVVVPTDLDRDVLTWQGEELEEK